MKKKNPFKEKSTYVTYAISNEDIRKLIKDKKNEELIFFEITEFFDKKCRCSGIANYYDESHYFEDDSDANPYFIIELSQETQKEKLDNQKFLDDLFGGILKVIEDYNGNVLTCSSTIFNREVILEINQNLTDIDLENIVEMINEECRGTQKVIGKSFNKSSSGDKFLHLVIEAGKYKEQMDSEISKIINEYLKKMP